MAKAEDNYFFKECKERSSSDFKNEFAEDQQQKYDPLFYCRTCANKDDSFVPIFKGEGLNHQLSKKIEKYLPIHVSRDDDLPLQLCYNCASTIIAWDTLVIGCVEAEKKLNSLKTTIGNYVSADPVKNEPLEEPCPVASEGTDSDDEPLITKKLAIVKNSKKRKVNKKDGIEEKPERSEIQKSLSPVENEDDRRTKSIPRRRTKKILIAGSEVINNTNNSWKDSTENKMVETYSVSAHRSDTKSCSDEHPDYGGYHCPVCFRMFEKTTSFCEDLYEHLEEKPTLETNGESSKFKCKICNEVFNKINELPDHLLFHLDSKRVIFSEGRAIGGGGRKRKKKKKNGIEDNPIKTACEICGKTISRKYTMKRHLITHSGEKRFTCHHCGKQYAQESGLQRHMSVIHEGLRKYKCPICSKIFGSNFELKTHQYTHTDPRPFQCDQCGRTFICQKHLYHHRKYHHTVNGLRQLCKICNRYFSSPGVLKRHHKVIHLGLKEFQCHVCSAQLSTKQYLQEHLKIHTDERPEVCSFCGKTFQMAGNLRQHLKIHMEKTQICDVCGKSFTRRCHLLTHMGSHKGIEQPHCQHCNKKFLLKIDLEKHLKNEHDQRTISVDVHKELQPDFFKEITVP